jgi:hypothetical protein
MAGLRERLQIYQGRLDATLGQRTSEHRETGHEEVKPTLKNARKRQVRMSVGFRNASDKKLPQRHLEKRNLLDSGNSKLHRVI